MSDKALWVIISVASLNFCAMSIAQEAHNSVKYNEVMYFFQLDSEEKLTLKIKNASSSEKTFFTNAQYLHQWGISGFPQQAAIQFRTLDNKLIQLKDQNENGWLYPNIYSSKLDMRIFDRDDKSVRENIADHTSELLIEADATAEFPFNYRTGIRHVIPELEAVGAKEIEFRVMWRIEIVESGMIAHLQIISDWFACEPMALE